MKKVRKSRRRLITNFVVQVTPTVNVREGEKKQAAKPELSRILTLNRRENMAINLGELSSRAVEVWLNLKKKKKKNTCYENISFLRPDLLNSVKTPPALITIIISVVNSHQHRVVVVHLVAWAVKGSKVWKIYCKTFFFFFLRVISVFPLFFCHFLAIVRCRYARRPGHRPMASHNGASAFIGLGER